FTVVLFFAEHPANSIPTLKHAANKRLFIVLPLFYLIKISQKENLTIVHFGQWHKLVFVRNEKNHRY
ncbi:hypothetical protein, partial [Solobacterium moorei]|uniref:hypothetical protein n=1 Tax=Solobacterium moorei TaxID=102148 RepID=UPI0028D505D3